LRYKPCAQEQGNEIYQTNQCGIFTGKIEVKIYRTPVRSVDDLQITGCRNYIPNIMKWMVNIAKYMYIVLYSSKRSILPICIYIYTVLNVIIIPYYELGVELGVQPTKNRQAYNLQT
jgi:hypothetical protein